MDGATHTPIEIQSKLGVELWMPSMGHGSAPVNVAKVTDAHGIPLIGIYRASNIFFIMPGAWEVRFSLINSDGTKETQTWNVTIEAESNSHGHMN